VRVLLPLLALAALAGAVYVIALAGEARRRRLNAKWFANTRLDKGHIFVEVQRGKERRTVKMLDAGMDPLDFKIEFPLAVEEADEIAATLNRPKR
jgi:hypothetical protein